MKTSSTLRRLGSFFVVALMFTSRAWAAQNQILGWNNLGMHCMDSDYSVFSILPPYNTIESQLIVGGKLVTNGNGYSVTYEAVADPNGSINSTAMGKGNYFDYATALFGAKLAPEAGLAGWSMPGVGNIPQSMLFERTNRPASGVATPVNWFRAEGIPISPYDDAHRKNPYPLMRLIARNSAHQAIATNDIVLPVSDEMDCRTCHASGTQSAAQPAAGWFWGGIPERDFRLNILRLHDEHQFAQHPVLYQQALAALGFNPQGLFRGVIADKKPVLCAACHASEALGTPSFSTIPPLTSSMHAFHAQVEDPILKTTLDDSANRASCYRCHPGSTTKCLRGAMGGAVAADGSMEMQCQSCHGNMTAVGSINRVGWFMEPTCQNCHSGTATRNNGLIRYLTAFETNGLPRVPVDTTFATTPNTPAPGLSLYRFSAGHGGLQCSACHGSTHAEFPSTHDNDNLRNLSLQGHVGVMAECTACHTTMPVTSATASGGPHGMHPIGQSWVSGHHDLIQGNQSKCQACHGADGRGTVLSRAQGDRTLRANFDGGSVTLNLFRGAIVGCYACHNGPRSESINNSAPPAVATISTNTLNSAPVSFAVNVTPTTASLRILSQPANGSLGVSNHILTYFPNDGYVGTDRFTYAAWDGAKNSNLATGMVSVAQGPIHLTATTHVPSSYPAGWPVAFAVIPVLSNSSSHTSFQWDFGDVSPAETNQFPAHAYTAPGDYTWSVTASADTEHLTLTGVITIGTPVTLGLTRTDSSVKVSWPTTLAEPILEATGDIGGQAEWFWVTTPPTVTESETSVALPLTDKNAFFRLQRPW